MTRRIFKSAGTQLGFGLIVCLAFFVGCRRSAEDVHPRRGPLVEGVYGLGTVTPHQSFQLKLASPATIQALFVREGEAVAIGAPLVSLTDGRMFRAPIRGTVTALPFKAGENVFAQAVIVHLVDLEQRYLLVTLEQQGALRVQAGQPVRLSFESLRGQRFGGVVRTIYPSDGQFFVHIDPDPLPAEVLPGMTADVAIEVRRREDVLQVPIAAVTTNSVTVRRNGTRHTISVELGAIDGEWAEVLAGELTPDDTLVLPR